MFIQSTRKGWLMGCVNLTPPVTETADSVTSEFFGVQSEATRRQRIIQLLLGAGLCAGLIPLLTVVNIAYDLWFGPGLQLLPETGELIPFLRFTGQFLQ
jgi:hypothetical protein